MPTYCYECNSCGHQFEEVQRMADPALVDCPECKMPDLRRVPQPGAAVGISGMYREPIHSDTYGAPNKEQQAHCEKTHKMEFDSQGRAIIRSPKEFDRISKIFAKPT